MINKFIFQNFQFQKCYVVKDTITITNKWQIVGQIEPLEEAEIDIWCVPINESLLNYLDSLTSILSNAELVRLKKFRFEEDQQRFVISHAVLRVLLAGYLKMQAQDIRFSIGLQGKPSLEPEMKQSITFNISHSGDMALLAFSTGRSLGVDIEFIHELPEFENLITRFFSQTERNCFALLNSEQNVDAILTRWRRNIAFFTCWTRKEAFIKARGNGLSLPLDQFDVSILPEQPARLLNTRWDPSEAEHWLMTDILINHQYKAALAAENTLKGFPFIELIPKI